MIPPFSVIVPVRNEALMLSKTAPSLREATKGLPAEIIYVLNATDDESATIIAGCFGDQACILETPKPGKARALRIGDRAASRSLRIYLDADVLVQSDTIKVVLATLCSGEADLVAPRVKVNLQGLGGFSLRVTRVWADQISRRQDAFMGCIGMSAAGLDARGEWPDVLADDDWARSRIPPSRRRILETTYIEISLPRDVLSWIKVRARWIRGTRQLRQMNVETAPVRQLRPRGSLPDLAIYYLIRLLAEPFASVQEWMGADWGMAKSTRTPADD